MKKEMKTTDKFRKSGIGIIGNVSWGTHLCQFYHTKDDLIDILVPYFKAGLENNELCMWITSEPLKIEDAKTALKKAVNNLNDYIKKGQIEIIDCTRWYAKPEKFEANKVLQGWIEKEKQSIEKGFDGLRLTGNTFWLEKKDWKIFVDYEETVNNIISKHKMIAICSYFLDKCGASEILDVMKNHQFALIRREGKWKTIESSECKKAEDKLRISQERYNLATRAAKVGVWDWDIENNKFYLDPNVKANLGYKDDEIPNDLNKWVEYVHPDDKEPVMKAAQDHMDGKTPEYVFEHRMFHKDGSIRWIMVRGKAIRNSEGKVVRFVGTDTDITERKKAEEKLKESEQRLKTLLNLSPVSVIIATIDGKIEYVNDATCDMFGYKKEDVVGMMTEEFFVDPKERDKSIEIIKKEGQRLNYTFHYKKKDKKTGIALANSKLIDLGEGLRLVIKLIDITDLKKLEKDKRILSEKVAKLTKKIPLTQNEKLVFYGLVKYPLLNDHQLSERFNIKRSTITAIKNKLLRQGFYSTYAIPNFELIGCELMCIINGKSPIETIVERKWLGIIKKIMSSPEIVYDIGTDKEFLSIIVSKNFVEIKKLIDYASSFHEENDIEMPNPTYFPFTMSKIINLFNHSGLLKSLFDLKIEEEDITKPIKSIKRELTNNEKIVLYALTKYPDLTDTEIVAKTKISRPTLSQIKKNLIKENFLKIVNIPDAKKLNCELLAYSKRVIDPKKIDNQKLSPLPEQLVFMVNSERDSSGILIFENYTTHKITYDKSINFLKKQHLMIGEPTMHLFPIQQIKFQKMDFAPLVKKIFELKVDF